MIKQLIKQQAAKIAAQPIVLSRQLAGKACILTFHRVLPDEMIKQPQAQSGIVLYQSEFDKLLSWLKKRFTIVSLSELAKDLEQHCLPDKPLLALTFDDGWKDNVQYALPVLQQHQISASLFLATAYIGSNKNFWWYDLARALNAGNCISTINAMLTLNQQEQALLNKAQIVGKQQWLVIDELVALLKFHPQEQLDLLANKLAEQLTQEPTMMSWQDVDQWLTSGREIGAHSVNHHILTALPLNQACDEISRSYQVLIERYGKKNVLDIFCYPNGKSSEAIHDYLREDFRFALSTQRGLVSYNSPVYQLPRYNISSDIGRRPETLAFRIMKSL